MGDFWHPKEAGVKMGSKERKNISIRWLVAGMVVAGSSLLVDNQGIDHEDQGISRGQSISKDINSDQNAPIIEPDFSIMGIDSIAPESTTTPTQIPTSIAETIPTERS